MTRRLLLFAGLLAPAASAQLVVPPAREVAASFALPLVGGDTLRLADLSGRVVVLNLWATWCAPCVRELPDLARLHHAFAGRGLTVLGVAEAQSDPAAIRAYAQRFSIPYPLAFPDTALPPSYGPRNVWPSTFVIDRRGGVRLYLQGPTTYDELAPLVEAVLDET